ncbi:MAG: hypothetical protein ACXVHS_04015 [Methanobacterium sp.]
MNGIKEIKYVKITPFTLIASSTASILALIYALIVLIISGLLTFSLPELADFRMVITGSGIASVIIFPITAYFIIIVLGFFSALLYNLLAPHMGGIKLELEDNEITKIPIVSLSLIFASIEAIWALIIGLFGAAAIIPLSVTIGQFQTINYIFNQIINIITVIVPISSVFGSNEFILPLFLVIGLPIGIFILGIISNALFAIFYNYVATRFIKIKLDFVKISGSLYKISSLPVVPAAAPTAAAVFGAFGAIMGFVSLLSLAVTGNPSVGNLENDIAVIVINGISYFVGYFLIFALIAIIYNFIAPIIGPIKLKME